MEKGSNQEKIYQYLMAVEKLAHEIIVEKGEIVLLDKRRNSFREAIRDLKKSGQKKCYMTVGTIIVKQNAKCTISIMEEDIKQVNVSINKLRSNLKVKVNELRDLEMLPPVPGMSLAPLSQEEMSALRQMV